jgi:hypothetical protein
MRGRISLPVIGGFSIKDRRELEFTNRLLNYGEKPAKGSNQHYW